MLTSSVALKLQDSWQHIQAEHPQKATQREGASDKLIKNIQNQESKGKRVRSEELGKEQEPGARESWDVRGGVCI